MSNEDSENGEEWVDDKDVTTINCRHTPIASDHRRNWNRELNALSRWSTAFTSSQLAICALACQLASLITVAAKHGDNIMGGLTVGLRAHSTAQLTDLSGPVVRT